MQIDNSSRFTDVKSFIVTIHTKNGEKDITQSVSFANIFLDVFSPFWSAELSILDTTNLITYLPINMFDKVTISAETQNDSIVDAQKKFDFRIFKINKNHDNHNVYDYTISLISELAFKNEKKTVCEVLKNERYTDAISKVVGYLGASLECKNKSSNNVTAIIPNWTPLATTMWLIKGALHNKTADYLFFQSDDNKFCTKSFEWSYQDDENKSGLTLNLRPSDMRDLDGNLMYDYSTSISKYTMHHYDGIVGIHSGGFASKIINYDLTKKIASSKIFNYGDDIPKDLEYAKFDKDLVKDTYVGSIHFNVKYDKKTDDNKDIAHTIEKWAGSRMSSMFKMDIERMTAQVPSGLRYWQALGKSIEIDMPSMQDMKEDELLDKYYKGRYLVTHVALYLSKAGFVTNLGLIKKRHETKEE